jgi:Chaperone of endosialidase
MKRIFNILIISLLAFDALSQSATILPNTVGVPNLSTMPTCNATQKGKQVFNTNDNKMYFCNGTAWTDMTVGGFTLPYSGIGHTTDSSIPLLKIENTSQDAIFGESAFSFGIIGRNNSPNGGFGYGGVGGFATGAFAGLFQNSSSDYPALFASNSGTHRAGAFGGDVSVSGILTVGINTDATPSNVNLHIKGKNNGTWNQGIKLESPVSTNYGGILFDQDGMKFRNFQSNDEFFFRDYNNNTRVRFSTAGNIYLDGTVFPNSDSRLKRNIQPINFSFKNLQKLTGYNYYWKEAKTDDDLQTGLIAQEVQAIFPELVATDESGMLSVNYMGLIPHLVEAVKDLKKENDDLKKRLDKIEKLLK